MLMIKNAEVYSPAYEGRKDVLICNNKIEWIADRIPDMPGHCQVIDGEGLCLVPGLIDNHVHVTGGGGEGSFFTRTPEIQLSELIESGITTVMGLIGTDGMTRSAENLYAKTKALNEEGVTAYMFTGAYGHPGPTITGEADRDIVFIDEVLGLKLAISDHRAPNVSQDELIRIASKTRVAGMLSGKPGVVILHMGDAKSGLKPVFAAIENTAIPAKIFRPTHVNRNEDLLEEGYEFMVKGGYIDLTCGIKGQPKPGDCVAEAKKRGLPLENITFSSDGHGSWSNYAPDGTLLEIGVSGVASIFKEVRRMVQEMDMDLQDALPYLTSNVAKAMEIYPQKGCLQEGSDADMLLLDKDLGIHTVIAKGQIMMEKGELKKKGTYEK